ncbi:NACHT, LRR and PYD domains-containing protein 3-like [Mustelus asterias]
MECEVVDSETQVLNLNEGKYEDMKPNGDITIMARQYLYILTVLPLLIQHWYYNRQVVDLEPSEPKTLDSSKHVIETAGVYAFLLGLFEVIAIITWMMGSMGLWRHTKEVTNNNISWRSEAGELNVGDECKITAQIENVLYLCHESHSLFSKLHGKLSRIPMSPSLNAVLFLKCVKEAHFRHRGRILQKTKRLIDIITGAKLLDDIFINIMIAAPVRDRSVVESEVKALGRLREELQSKNILKEYTHDQLFSSSSGNASRTWATLVIGAAGIGKSTLIQKMIREWAQGKIHKQFAFVFHFKFLELNFIPVRTNLTNLILDSYPYLENVLELLWQEPTKLLFIFDDFNRFEHTVHFTDFLSGKDQQTHGFHPESYCEVSEIVRRLVQGELLKGCSVLITTRPWQLELFEKASINLTVEIRGFTSEQIKLYFQQCYCGEQFATEVTEYIRLNELLSTMCYNPLYCSVLSSLFASHLTQGVEWRSLSSITSTKVFSSYVTSLLDRHGCDRQYATDALLKLGEMAYQGICNQCFVYQKSQFNYHKLKLSNVIFTFMMEIPDKDRDGVVYTFAHSILQHFAAALVKTKLTPGNQVILLLREWNLCPDDRFQIVSNFLVGLTSKNSTDELKSKLIKCNTEAQTYVSDWLEENVKNKVQHLEEGKAQNKLLAMLHYLLEFGDANLMTVALTPTNIVNITHCPLTYTDCLVLSSVLMKVDRIEELNLGSCDIQADAMRQLEQLLSKCKILRLNDNKLGDSGLNLISAVLKQMDCKIQRLELKSNKLSDDCVEMLVSSLSENGSLRELDLSNDDMPGDQANCLTDKSVPALKRLIENCSNLKEIKLTHNQFSAAGQNTLKQHHLSDKLTVIA